MSQESGGRNIKTDVSQLRGIQIRTSTQDKLITFFFSPNTKRCAYACICQTDILYLTSNSVSYWEERQCATLYNENSETFHDGKKFFSPAFEEFFSLTDSIKRMFFKALEWSLHVLFAGFIHLAGGLAEGSFFHEAVRKSRNITAGEV